ncbi:hypothetical protein DOY81_003469 [Sarcophaga bullata]|nr:hypothetical protein DOY81_003469 [Sarcophaga bullata]
MVLNHNTVPAEMINVENSNWIINARSARRKLADQMNAEELDSTTLEIQSRLWSCSNDSSTTYLRLSADFETDEVEFVAFLNVAVCTLY